MPLCPSFDIRKQEQLASNIDDDNDDDDAMDNNNNNDNQPGQPNQPNQPDQPGQANQPNQPDQPGQANQPNQADQPFVRMFAMLAEMTDVCNHANQSVVQLNAMRVNFVATEQEYLAAAAAAEGEAVDGAAPEPLLQYLLHSVQRLQEGLEQIQEEQLQLQQLQQLQVRVAVLEGQAQWFRVIGQPRLYLHIARLNRQLQRQIRRLQQQQQQHEQEQEQELLEDAGIAGNANMDDVGWGMDAGDEFAEEAEIVEGVQAVIPAAVQAVIPAAVPAVVPAVIPAVVPAVVPVVVPAAAPAADVMTLLHQVLAGQEGLQAQFRVLDWRVQNHDAERYNSQNSILGTQMIRPLIKMRQGFTPDPRRVIPMGRGGRNILPGRDNIPAGVLPGPANVGFEFPASQSALQDLKLRQLYRLVQFYDIVDENLSVSQRGWQITALRARLLMFLGVTMTM